MIQPNNRHMSISLYLTVLAVAETIILILGGYFWVCKSQSFLSGTRLQISLNIAFCLVLEC